MQFNSRMLGFSSKRRLINLLDGIRDGEQQQESLRQRLCSIPGFAPYSAFMRVDRDAKERVTAQDILDFLRDNREYTIDSIDCYNLVKYFDTNGDNTLSPLE